MKPRHILLPLVALCLAWPAQARLSPEDIVQLRNVGAVNISPDGQHVANTVSTLAGFRGGG
jgi:hypothetical protein